MGRARLPPNVPSRTSRIRLYLNRIPPLTMAKTSILREFWSFLRVRKKFWLAPIVLMLVMLSLLMVLTQGSALAPFVYALF